MTHIAAAFIAEFEPYAFGCPPNGQLLTHLLANTWMEGVWMYSEVVREESPGQSKGSSEDVTWITSRCVWTGEAAWC